MQIRMQGNTTSLYLVGKSVVTAKTGTSLVFIIADTIVLYDGFALLAYFATHVFSGCSHYLLICQLRKTSIENACARKYKSRTCACLPQDYRLVVFPCILILR